MSESVVIQCPKCRKKLRLPREKLGKQFRCPGCQSTLSTKVPDTGSPRPAKSPSPRTSPPISGSKSSSRPKPQPNSSRNKSGSVRKKKKSRPQPVIDDPWADQAADDGYGDDLYDNYGDDFADDYGDDYGDDYYADDGDAYGDSYSDDPYAGGLPSPRPKKKKKSSGAQTKKKLKRGEIQDLNTGFLGWVLAGLIGGAVGILLTTLTGYQPYAIFTYLMAIITGSLVGGAVRYAAGVNDGWGPGLVAAAIGLASIIGGRVGAFYVSPELNAFFGDEDLTPAQIQERIDEAASEDGMIAMIAGDQVEYSEEVMRKIGVTEQQIDDHYENVAEDAPFRDQYLPQVWDEATRRWNLLPQAERESRQWNTRIETMSDYGVLDEDTMKSHIDYMQSDFEMTKRVANGLTYDQDWLRQAGISDNDVQTINPERDAESYGYHPAIWQEAQIRWVELPDDEKETERAAVESQIRDNYDVGEALELDELRGKIHILAAVVAGLVSLFLPIWGFFFCTCSGVIGAFKLGAGLVTD